MVCWVDKVSKAHQVKSTGVQAFCWGSGICDGIPCDHPPHEKIHFAIEVIHSFACQSLPLCLAQIGHGFALRDLTAIEQKDAITNYQHFIMHT